MEFITKLISDTMELQWLPVIFQAQLKVLGPGYMKDCRTLQVAAQPLWASAESLLCVPPLLEAQLVGTRKRAFFTVAP